MANHVDGSVELLCFGCGYDLRAHPPDGICPECGGSVAESQRMAAFPYRPAWRNSDPRWRRRVIAGLWILVLLPAIDVLQMAGWAASVPAPTVFDFRGTVRTLDHTFLFEWGVYQPLIFCVGVVLLFSKERGRRRNQLDWTRRWGIICSYVTLLLAAARVLFIGALVLAGISALFMSMPLKYQPPVTRFFAEVSSAYLRYGPRPRTICGIVTVAFSSIAILLACVPLFNALRSTGPKRLAALMVAPLALFSLTNLSQVFLSCLHAGGFAADIINYQVYFRPALLPAVADPNILIMLGPSFIIPVFVEVAKWCIVLAIAVWLSIAQLAAWRQRKKMRAA